MEHLGTERKTVEGDHSKKNQQKENNKTHNIVSSICFVSDSLETREGTNLSV